LRPWFLLAVHEGLRVAAGSLSKDGAALEAKGFEALTGGWAPAVEGKKGLTFMFDSKNKASFR
jgi:hypothetical protein